MELGLEKALIPSGAPLKLQRKAAEIGYIPPHTHTPPGLMGTPNESSRPP